MFIPPPLLLVSYFRHNIAVEGAMADNSACGFQIDIAIYERIVDAVRYRDVAKVFDKLPKLLRVNLSKDSDKDSNHHFKLPLSIVLKPFNVQRFITSYLPD